MNFSKLISMLAVVLLSAIIFTSCEETTNDPITDVPEAPDAIAAVSVNSTSVKIGWEASPSESDDMFDGYTLIVTPGAAAPIAIPEGTYEYTVTNLTEGDVYTFTLSAEYSNGESSTPVEIQWSPASRYTDVFGETIKLYGSSSSVGSGLDLFDNTEDGPMVRSVSSSNLWNFAFDDRGGAYFGTAGEGIVEYNWSAGAPAVSGELGNYFFELATLDEAYESAPLNDGIDYNYSSYDLSKYADAAGLILYGRVSTGSDYNYARILIKNTANGYVQSDALGNYIEVEISYQNEAGVPYAGIEQ